MSNKINPSISPYVADTQNTHKSAWAPKLEPTRQTESKVIEVASKHCRLDDPSKDAVPIVCSKESLSDAVPVNTSSQNKPKSIWNRFFTPKNKISPLFPDATKATNATEIADKTKVSKKAWMEEEGDSNIHQQQKNTPLMELIADPELDSVNGDFLEAPNGHNTPPAVPMRNSTVNDTPSSNFLMPLDDDGDDDDNTPPTVLMEISTNDGPPISNFLMPLDENE